MHAIVSLLDPASYEQVQAIWKKLEDECDLRGNRVTPYPHISWQVAEDYRTDLLAKRLARLAARSTPILLHCSGLGLFTGAEPVLFINTIKDKTLIRYHDRVIHAAKNVVVGPSDYYQPQLWMPHITLAHRGLNAEALACALRDLAFQDFNWEIRLDNLALVCQEGEEIGQLKVRWNFPPEEVA
ncbi:MAG TPA: 2'-5' RNA ligase family protein [Anaerolineaceae bacterium]|nr:2'-5' RNA ligase family protein [Anaerolineaceae bacterium]